MSVQPDIRPNLFIVGAPKCGTTSLYEYLRQHPQIYFPANELDFFRTKEPNHFCPELDIHAKLAITDRAEYLALYERAGCARWRGDASTHHLYSQKAAASIRQFSPEARILIALRPPIAMMRSYHNDLVRHRFEDISDFHEAVAASDSRRNGLHIPAGTPVPRCLDYLGMSRFAPQVERYLDVFGAAAVKVVLLEDLAASPATLVRQILHFLGADPSFEPVFQIHNETPRDSKPERWLTSLYRHRRVHKLARSLIPHSVRRAVLGSIRHGAKSSADGDPRDAQLRAACAADVHRLATLLHRDLTHWL